MPDFQVSAIMDNMKIILLQDFKKIGKKGDIKEVSDGFARNFLFPKKIAEIATEMSVRKAETLRQKHAQEEQADLEKFQRLAGQLEGRDIIIQAKEKEGKLFGAIHAKDISKELKKENLVVPEKCIVLKSPIKELGEYDIKIELEHGIEAAIKIIVEKA